MKLTFALAPIELKQHTTAMVAFDMMNDPLGDQVEEAHVTLLFLGELVDLESQYDAIRAALDQFSSTHAPISGKFGGVAIFPVTEENDNKAPVVSLFDSPELPAFRQALLHALGNVLPGILDQTHGYTAHMTLSYTDKPSLDLPTSAAQYVKTFDQITLYWGDEKQSYPLSGAVVEKQLPIDPKSAQNLITIRLGVFNNDVDALAERVFTGDITVGAWVEEMKSLIRGVHTGVASIAKLGWGNVSQAEWGVVGAEVKKQYRFLQNFAEDILANKDTISLAAIQARAHMYGQSAGHTAALMQAGNLAGGTRRKPTGYGSLPWIPKDGSTRCAQNCLCHWEIEVLSTDADSQTIQATWVVNESAESCPDCVDRIGFTTTLTVPLDWEIPEIIG